MCRANGMLTLPEKFNWRQPTWIGTRHLLEAWNQWLPWLVSFYLFFFFFNIKECLTICMYFSFPESQGDALLLEVRDAKKTVQGRATIPISSLTDNPVCNIFRFSNDESSLMLIILPSHDCNLMWLFKQCRMIELGGGLFIMMIMNVLERSSYLYVEQLHVTRLLPWRFNYSISK